MIESLESYAPKRVCHSHLMLSQGEFATIVRCVHQADLSPQVAIGPDRFGLDPMIINHLASDTMLPPH